MDETLIDAVLEDIDSAPIDARFKPILRFVKKLTETPYKMIQADADAVFAEGWSEHALSDAICVCAHFNMVNRLVDGHGINLFQAWHDRENMRDLAAKAANVNYTNYVFDKEDRSDA